MINKVTLLGYVGDEPEIRSFESGSKLARIRVATNEKIFVRKSNEVHQHTEWHTVIFWRERADFIDKYIHKGTQVYLEGALRSREEVTKEGVKIRIVEILGKEIKIISQPKSIRETSTTNTTTSTTPPKITPPKDDLDDLPF